MKLAFSKTMREADAFAINEQGVPSTLLMSRAADAVAAAALELSGRERPRVAVFCGSGNNGGDGVAAARRLKLGSCEVRVFLVGSCEKLTADTAEMERRLKELGGKLELFEGTDDVREYCAGCDVIIDAMFGVGLNSPLRGAALEAAELINSLPVPVVAADIASGVSADTGEILGEAVRADVTVTFTAAKPGHFLEPGCVCCGALKVADIGIEPRGDDGVYAVTEEDVSFPPRKPLSHKGDYGKVFIVGGSEGYTGAPVMAALSAQKSGAGLVFLAVPESIYPITAQALKEPMPLMLPGGADGRFSVQAVPEILRRAEKCDCLLIGPGLGRSEELNSAVAEILEKTDIPAVVDADGINALAENIDVLEQRRAVTILTPHEVEFKRLGGDISAGGRLAAARAFAEKYGCVLVLKGHRTITAFPDGTAYINTCGNAGMAKGGSGDVLAGAIASFTAQFKGETRRAVPAAVYLHSAAADAAAERRGQAALLPTDTIEYFGEIMK